MIALEFRKSDDDFNVEWIFNEMLKRGFIVGVKPEANLIRFMPALTSEQSEMESILQNLNGVLQEST